MQSVIRSSEQRVVKERRNTEAARLRACRQHTTLVLLGLLLVAFLALSNIVLLRSVLQNPMGGSDAPVRPGIGPLLREQLRQKAKRKFGRVKKWFRGGGRGSSNATEASGSMEEAPVAAAVDPLKEERLRFQKMHAALLGHNATASGNASQALKQALGLATLTQPATESPPEVQAPGA